VSKVPYFAEIITIVADVTIVTAIHFYLITVKAESSLEVLYLFVTGIIPILFYIFYKIFAVHQLVAAHTDYFRNIIGALKLHVNYEKGETEILKLLSEKRGLSKDNFYAVWCMDYQQPLESYFEQEKELYKRGINRHRLINKNFLHNKREDIRKHLSENEDAIRKNKYFVYSTNLTDFEIIICDRAMNDQDAIAIQLFRDIANPRVELAIYSHNESFVQAMREVFRHNQKDALQVEPNTDFSHSVEEWLNS
jgi:hypothetical protein